MKTIELFVKIKVDHLKSIIERFITILCFEPQNMDVYYNEFKKMKEDELRGYNLSLKFLADYENNNIYPVEIFE